MTHQALSSGVVKDLPLHDREFMIRSRHMTLQRLIAT
jgi:hypothetical protein